MSTPPAAAIASNGKSPSGGRHGKLKREGRSGGKKVEFSPSLSSIDSQAATLPRSPGMAWDAETDHMLSYFLGGAEGLHNGGTVPDFAPYATRPMEVDEGKTELPLEDPAPPTPSVQHFYTSSSSSGGANALHRDSSQSSLANMAASLMIGNPMMLRLQSQQGQQQTTASLNSMARASSAGSFSTAPSPLSPTALIGSSHENLLLPTAAGSDRPPTSNNHLPRDDANASAAGEKNQQTQQLSFLQDINVRAKRAQYYEAQQQGATQHNGTTATTAQLPQAVAALGAAGFLPGAPNPFLLAQILAAHKETKPPVESEEKRSKRLERNRESARRSRLKKKTRLATLEVQVNTLHGQIEEERRSQINNMVAVFGKWRVKEMGLQQVGLGNAVSDASWLADIIQYSSPGGPASRSVVDFQYNRLRYLVLPSYQKFVLWCVSHQESFYLSAKEGYTRTGNLKKGSSKAPPGKASAKQIGEDLFTAGTAVRPDKNGSSKKDKVASCHSWDESRSWPLFCFELKVSVEQEERFLTTHRKHREGKGLTGDLSEAQAAVKAVDSLRSAVESVSNLVARREEQSYLSILDPRQTAAYHAWLSTKQGGLLQLVQANRDKMNVEVDGEAVKDSTLLDVCKRLKEVLQISKSD